MVAISRERSATAEYIVFSAPKTAPMPMTTATMRADHRDERGQLPRLLRVVVDLAVHLHGEARIGGERVLEPVSASGRRSSRTVTDWKRFAGTLEDLLEHVGVAPELGVEGACPPASTTPTTVHVPPPKRTVLPSSRPT